MVRKKSFVVGSTVIGKTVERYSVHQKKAIWWVDKGERNSVYPRHGIRRGGGGKGGSWGKNAPVRGKGKGSHLVHDHTQVYSPSCGGQTTVLRKKKAKGEKIGSTSKKKHNPSLLNQMCINHLTFNGQKRKRVPLKNEKGTFPGDKVGMPLQKRGGQIPTQRNCCVTVGKAPGQGETANCSDRKFVTGERGRQGRCGGGPFLVGGNMGYSGRSSMGRGGVSAC